MTAQAGRHRSVERSPIDAARFVGRWSVRRRVVDRLASATHGFVGTAFLTFERFVETGTLRIGDRELEAERSYGLLFDDRGVDVSYPDGSAFVRLDFANSKAVRHVCGNDLYVGRVGLRSQDAWVEAWHVRGPRKHYSSVCRYERLRTD